MILTSDGYVYGWGDNLYGQLGCGPDRDMRKGDTFRVNFNPIYEIKSILCCFYSSFAITSEGQVFSWGRNAKNNLGHNSLRDIWEPQLISGLSDIKTICSGGDFSEVNDYNRLYEELHSLGSGSFGEVVVVKRKYDGLEYAIMTICWNIIHRDLKPDNILIARKVRNGRFIKLGDFGLATLHSSSPGSHTTGVGTRQYMPPEFP
ncbi:unnamed protein product [Oppiella nova]|uniref:Protein kinase domain-containing protein n=1 Tax=Oppiella nova TaxID=334625 RepID=A0A7R9MD95_9ACAR|nr:unnamed protein product [Oppiella nova]CAG2175163.1 unnamed protein product [Oppiella nova]